MAQARQRGEMAQGPWQETVQEAAQADGPGARVGDGGEAAQEMAHSGDGAGGRWWETAGAGKGKFTCLKGSARQTTAASSVGMGWLKPMVPVTVQCWCRSANPTLDPYLWTRTAKPTGLPKPGELPYIRENSLLFLLTVA